MKKIYMFVLAVIFSVISVGIISGLAVGSASQLTYYVMPPAYVSSAGGASFLGPLSNAQRTYQMLLHDTLLSGLEGQDIKAITWRLLPSASSNWPAADVTFSNYDIYIGEGIDPSQRHFTFDSNYAVFGVKKRVRFGPLTILAGSFPFGGNPTTFGTDITFDSTYRYNGGHLTIEIRHAGFTGTSASVDAAGTSSPGYLVTYSGCWASSYTATSTTNQANLCIHRLNAEQPVSVWNESGIVKDFALLQNYPNPFNPVTNINFTMPKAGRVTLKVYDVSGTEVMAIVNDEHLSAGTKSQFFDASALSSGVYFYSLYIDGAKIDTKKMMLIK